MQVVLTQEEYNALEGRGSLKAAAQMKTFRHLLATKIASRVESDYRGEASIQVRALVKLIDESADEAFK